MFELCTHLSSILNVNYVGYIFNVSDDYIE